MIPETIECALRGDCFPRRYFSSHCVLGVYGSLWNQRAIEERTYARYRHDTSVMGVAVVARYKELGTVTGNAVAITRLVATPGVLAHVL